jgi:hypothetical protein
MGGRLERYKQDFGWTQRIVHLLFVLLMLTGTILAWEGVLILVATIIVYVFVLTALDVIDWAITPKGKLKSGWWWETLLTRKG